MLVIVTTLDLDPASKRYKSDKVGRLKDAAHEWLDAHAAEADGYVLINRPKDWPAPHGAPALAD